ncbi:MAG: TRAP transporter substrate-binding protein [Betaproteobacteria bacterium]|nr:TRAP transporter substrate-binding protein [Betaproteobacteria bacterium]
MTIANSIRRRFLMAAALTCAFAGVTAQAQTFTARFGGYLAGQDPTNVAAQKMAELADKASNGRLKITVFADGKLGNEREVTEALRTGGAELVATLGTGLAQYVPEVGVLELPFTSRSDHCAVQTFLDVMPDVERLSVPKGFRPLTAWGIGERGLLTKKPVRALDDLKGMKMRGPAPLYLGTLRALGANPVQMPWSEIYVGLDTGSIDGMEASPQMIYPSRFQETAKFYTVTRHINPGYYLLVSERFWQKMPPDLQKVMRESAEVAFGDLRKQGAKIWQENLDKMKSAGVEVIDLKDLGRWEKAVEGFRAEFAQKLGPAAESLAQRARESVAKCK